jgi:hypothetical protein
MLKKFFYFIASLICILSFYCCTYFRHRKRKIKRKEFRQAPGINSLALQEAQEIFGDVSSLLEERRRRDRDALAGLDDEERADDDDDDDYGRGRKPPPQKLLEKQFEPSLLEEKFLTERDDRLRETDIPERLQVRFFYFSRSLSFLSHASLALKSSILKCIHSLLFKRIFEVRWKFLLVKR